MLKTIGKKFNRALHFDFHTPPGVENIFGNFDAERFAEQLQEAHIEYVNITARCNMGFSYYNTKVGKKYPGLGDRDPLREILDACHKRGIGVTAYLNLGLNHEMAADHVDWLKIDQEGRVYQADKKDSFFRAMCHNSPYRAHFLAEIKELCAYDIDGLFCDCFCLKPCYCPACMADMAKRGVDVTDDAAVLDY
ncbi:MAG: alpha-L-fucosidase, partial [Clostridia bacterium]|nr:alpha-L-fucosidase [Clostridia bacterium]